MAEPRPKFYGWTMLGIAVAMAIATMPGQTVLLALFNTSIREALGLSIGALSLAYTVGTIAAGLPLPLVGRTADRFGLRRTVGVVALAFAGSVVLLREASGVVSLGVVFFLMRFLGQGALGMLAGHTISMWFERRLGAVHSILAIAGFAAGSTLLPPPTAWLITEIGWRDTLLVLACGVLLLTMPPLIVFRNRPEEIGQHLDGEATDRGPHDVMHGGPAPRNDPAFTARQAAGTAAFWILLTNMFSSGLVGTALLFHMQPLLQQGGLEGTEQQAAAAFLPWPIAFGVVMLLAGWLADRQPASRLLPASLGLMAGGVALCLVAARGMAGPSLTLPIMGMGMGLYGMSQAMTFGVGNPTIARYFGRTHHGSVRGWIATGTVFGTGAGPYVFSLASEAAGGSFTPALLASVATTLPLAVAASRLSAPTPPSHRDLTPEPDEPEMPGPVL